MPIPTISKLMWECLIIYFESLVCVYRYIYIYRYVISGKARWLCSAIENNPSWHNNTKIKQHIEYTTLPFACAGSLDEINLSASLITSNHDAPHTAFISFGGSSVLKPQLLLRFLPFFFIPYYILGESNNRTRAIFKYYGRYRDDPFQFHILSVSYSPIQTQTTK